MSSESISSTSERSPTYWVHELSFSLENIATIFLDSLCNHWGDQLVYPTWLFNATPKVHLLLQVLMWDTQIQFSPISIGTYTCFSPGFSIADLLIVFLLKSCLTSQTTCHCRGVLAFSWCPSLFPEAPSPGRISVTIVFQHCPLVRLQCSHSPFSTHTNNGAAKSMHKACGYSFPSKSSSPWG